MTERPEARLHPRFSVDIDAQVTLRGRKVVARTRDLSRSGICLVCPESVASGSEIHIDLALAFGSKAVSEPLQVDAKVVWCTPLFGAFQVGAMFLDLDPDKERFLEMFLRFLDGKIPPEALGVPADAESDESGSEDVELDDEDDDKETEDKDDPFRP